MHRRFWTSRVERIVLFILSWKSSSETGVIICRLKESVKKVNYSVTNGIWPLLWKQILDSVDEKRNIEHKMWSFQGHCYKKWILDSCIWYIFSQFGLLIIQDVSGSNSEFSFSLPGCHTKVIEHSLPYYSFTAGDREREPMNSYFSQRY